MREPLKVQFNTQGWKQFLTSRKEMLDAYDRAREKARSHEVETYHGKVAEAEFRKWLGSFLPKRYGVTSGYIISQGQSSKQKTPHFDVIIYDAIEAPVLWIEENPDTSTAGKSMAIPAEYVVGVIEVKSSFDATNVSKGIKHLADLDPLMGGPDDPNAKYKMYLPKNFFCGLVFFELRESTQYSQKALSNMISGINLRGYMGGLIMRGDTHTKPLSGRFIFTRKETPQESLIGKSKGSLLKLGISKSQRVLGNLHIYASLWWSETFFSQFAFDIITRIRGTYEMGFLSSFHGQGISEMEDSTNNAETTR